MPLKSTGDKANAASSTIGPSTIENQHVSVNTSDQFLTFVLAGEEYGVDILCVQEIRGWESATPLPNAPPHIKGVINLRGTIVPVIDLRQCFGLVAIEYTPVTVVIVLKVHADDRDRIMGVVVDAVSDVYTLVAKDIRPTPDLGHAINTEFVRGLVTVEQKMIILLDMNKLLLLDDVPNLSTLSEQLGVENSK